jgi:hypothetical protein
MGLPGGQPEWAVQDPAGAKIAISQFEPEIGSAVGRRRLALEKLEPSDLLAPEDGWFSGERAELEGIIDQESGEPVAMERDDRVDEVGALG